MRDRLIFFKEFFRSFKTTGSVTPSSRWAAEALTDAMRESTRPKNIIEIGPGTGSVTARIISDLIDGDHLTICEINPRFMKALQEKLEKDENFKKHRSQVSFFEGSVIDLSEERKFDVIICAIPFTNMEIGLVQRIFSKLERLSSDDTKLSFFEYAGLRDLGKVVSPKPRRERIRAVDQFIADLSEKYETTNKIVWLNFTPILIHTMHIKTQQAA